MRSTCVVAPACLLVSLSAADAVCIPLGACSVPPSSETKTTAASSPTTRQKGGGSSSSCARRGASWMRLTHRLQLDRHTKRLLPAPHLLQPHHLPHRAPPPLMPLPRHLHDRRRRPPHTAWALRPGTVSSTNSRVQAARTQVPRRRTVASYPPVPAAALVVVPLHR